MKNSIIAILMCACMVLTSCQTPTAKAILANAPGVISVVGPIAVSKGVEKHPKSAPYLNALVVVINTFALGTDLSPEALTATIKSAKIKELQTPETLNVANALVVLYKSYYDTAVTNKIASVENLVPILQAISKAITDGLPVVTE
jgi:uncharacterized membrane protein